MTDIAIVGAARTPIGRYGGALKDVEAQDLAAVVIKEAMERSSVLPAEVDEVIMGHVLVNGETPNVARVASLMAEIPVETPAYSLDRQCGSGLQAICNAALQIKAGQSAVVVAGGVESMSNMEYYVVGARWGIRAGNELFRDRWDRATEMVSSHRFGRISGMIETAENVAARCGISRLEQDELACLSHARATAAIKEGRFRDEVVPVSVQQKKGPPLIVDRDEHPRPETTLESLARLKPIVGETVTAGNASGMNDGAAACVLMARETARNRGIKPLAYLRDWVVTGIHPAYMGLGPVSSVRRLLERTRLQLGDIDLIELNEAFAAQALGCIKELDITDLANVNVNGSGIALGHPIGATGGRILVTLLYEMQRRDARYGLATMCVGGGMGIAALVERA